MASVVNDTELAAYVGVSGSYDKNTLASANAAVGTAIAEYCGRSFLKDTTATARVYRASDGYALEVHDFWTTTGLVIATDEDGDGTFETTWLTTDYQVEPLNASAFGRPYRQIVAVNTRSWPTLTRRAAAQITAKWGWASVPDDVKQAHFIQAARIWKRKDSVFGVAGGSDLGEIRMLASRFDPDVQVLLGPYRLGGTLAGPFTTRVR